MRARGRRNDGRTYEKERRGRAFEMDGCKRHTCGCRGESSLCAPLVPTRWACCLRPRPLACFLRPTSIHPLPGEASTRPNPPLICFVRARCSYHGGQVQSVRWSSRLTSTCSRSPLRLPSTRNTLRRRTRILNTSLLPPLDRTSASVTPSHRAHLPCPSQ